MPSKMIAAAAAVASLMLTSAATVAADASPHERAQAPKYFKSKVTPSTGVTPGTTLKMVGKKAKPSTAYYCLLAVYDADGGNVAAPYIATAQGVDSNAKGKVVCKMEYTPFSAADDNGVMRNCPTKASDRKDNFKCGVVLADAATEGALSASAAPFTPAR